MKEVKGLSIYGATLIGVSLASFIYGASIGSILILIIIFMIATGILAIVND